MAFMYATFLRASIPEIKEIPAAQALVTFIPLLHKYHTSLFEWVGVVTPRDVASGLLLASIGFRYVTDDIVALGVPLPAQSMRIADLLEPAGCSLRRFVVWHIHFLAAAMMASKSAPSLTWPEKIESWPGPSPHVEPAACPSVALRMP